MLLFFFSIGFSQNWSVINTVDKFNYRLDNDNIITATIWADSVQLNGSDTVFFLNRIMCDTCVTIIGGPNQCDTCYGAKNLPQFFQRQVSVSAAGIVNFRDTGNVVVNPFAALNDSWLFDSIWNVNATVIDVATDSVFSFVDSVKTILLSSGDSIKLSKNFGIIQYPFHYGLNSRYHLTGIEGRNLGEQVPKFADFFNFNIGDMFEYRDNSYFYEGCTGLINDFQGCRIIRKYSITNKSISGDTISYQLTGFRIKYCYALGMPWIRDTCFDLINESKTYIDSSDHFTNKYNREFLDLDYRLPRDTFIFYKIFDGVRMRVDSNSVLTKSFGAQSLGYSFYYYDTLLSPFSDTLTNAYFGDVYCSYTGTFRVGLGMTDHAVGGCFEGSYEEHLLAYRKNNDTVGVFTPDSVFTVGLNEPGYISPILIYPNPSSTIISVHLPCEEYAEIQLTDVQGKILVNESLTGNNSELDISHFENGLYFLLVKTNKKIFSQKVIILH